VLQDAAAYGPAGLVVVAGDFNLNTSKPRVAEVLAGAGFRNAVPSAHLATIPPRHLLEAGRPSTGLLFAGKCRSIKPGFTARLRHLSTVQSPYLSLRMRMKSSFDLPTARRFLE